MLGFKILSVISFGNYLGADIFNQISSSDLYSLTNQTRQANGLPALTPNSKLEAAAQLKMTDMFNNNYFAHNSPQGTTPWYWFGKANYKYSAAGENLAMNFYSSDQVMKAWMASELHKKNILLKNFSEIGIAIGYDKLNGEKTMVVVEMFGSPETKTIFSKSVTGHYLDEQTSSRLPGSSGDGCMVGGYVDDVGSLRVGGFLHPQFRDRYLGTRFSLGVK